MCDYSRTPIRKLEERILENTKRKKAILPIILFFITILLFIIPSIRYILQNGTIYGFHHVWTFLFRSPINANEKMLNAILFSMLFTLLFLTYLIVIKNHKRLKLKTMIILVIIASIMFGIIIPYTSTDVYSYIANGWSAAQYGENPYYTSTGEIVDKTGQNEPMFNKVANCWRYETVVYGPLWTSICTGLSALSQGNIDIALVLFKLANLIVHLINCILIYKITRKKLFVILYGLNPFILFEAISNVHNDIFIVLFILFAIYFTVRKKNLFLAVAFVAFATAIKYLAILILPFLVLYYVRKKEVKVRIGYCILCAVEYIAIIGALYLVYMRDLNVFAGLFMQQAKYNRSIFYVLYEYLGENITSIIQSVTLGIFAIFYIYVCIKLLLQKQMKFAMLMRKYNITLLIFTFILITNFNPWYIMWLFPSMFWLKAKSQDTILALSYSSQIANFMSFKLLSEEAILGIPYLKILVIGTIVIKLISRKTKITIK